MSRKYLDQRTFPETHLLESSSSEPGTNPAMFGRRCLEGLWSGPKTRERRDAQAGLELLDGRAQGARGQPLVVGTTMYLHSAFPNHVFALDLSKEGAPIKWKYTPKQDDRGRSSG